MVRTSAGRDLLLDGAHNPDGARCLRAFLDEQFSGVPITMMFGAMSDKPLAEMAQILFPAATTVIATRIANPRTVEPLRIEELALGFNRSALRAESAAEALAAAERTTPAGGLICAAGSLYLVGELEAILDR
jgi:dihydrofolate synthase/folylpolyglutamate synthase